MALAHSWRLGLTLESLENDFDGSNVALFSFGDKGVSYLAQMSLTVRAFLRQGDTQHVGQGATCFGAPASKLVAGLKGHD